jgi:hypothetical protein
MRPRRQLAACGVAASVGLGGCASLVGIQDFSPGSDAGTPNGGDESSDAGESSESSSPDAPAVGSDAGAGYIQGMAAASPMGASTLSVTLASPVGRHDAIVVGVQNDNSVLVSSVTDTVGNAYALLVGPGASQDERGYIYAAFDAGAGADTVTVTLTAPSGCGLAAHVAEYAGLTEFDVGNYDNGTTTAVDGVASGAVTTTADGELLIGYGFAYSSNPGYGVVTTGTGFTRRLFAYGFTLEDEPAPTKGSYAATGTMTNGTDWIMLGAAFKVP